MVSPKMDDHLAFIFVIVGMIVIMGSFFGAYRDPIHLITGLWLLVYAETLHLKAETKKMKMFLQSVFDRLKEEEDKLPSIEEMINESTEDTKPLRPTGKAKAGKVKKSGKARKNK